MRKYWLLIIFLFAGILLSCNSKRKTEEACNDEGNEVVSQTLVPKWSENATLYEVNIRQFTPEGTIDAFAEHLPRLKKMGVKILWLMPVQPISVKNRKGTLGSYYSVADYVKINPEYGTMNDFKAFVNKAHQLGFKVVLDWVANHTGWDHPWITNHPEWYTKDSLGNIIPPVPDWSDTADLNYDNDKMRKAMIDALKFWIVETGIDGYRCDMAKMVPTDFWNEARAELDKLKEIWMLAEAQDEIDLLESAFNCNYSWSLHHSLNSIAQGKANIGEIKAYFNEFYTTLPRGSYAIQFTSNHDENSWQGTVFERMGDAAKSMAALTFAIPGMPLIYSGQEAGLNKRLEFFEKDEIDWSNLDMQEFYAQLIDIKEQNRALWNGAAGANIHFLKTSESNNFLVFSREKGDNLVLALFNLSAERLTNNVTCKKINGTFIDLQTGKEHTLNNNTVFEFEPWEYKLLRKK